MNERNPLLRWIECHPGFAGYLQVLGVALSILVAAFIPWWLANRDARARRREALASVVAAVTRTKQALANLELAYGDVKGMATYLREGKGLADFKSLNAALVSTPTHLFGDALLAFRLIDIRSATIVICTVLEGSGEFGGTFVEWFDAYRARTIRLAEDALIDCDAFESRAIFIDGSK